jgi:hypothetical protein
MGIALSTKYVRISGSHSDSAAMSSLLFHQMSACDAYTGARPVNHHPFLWFIIENSALFSGVTRR